MAVVSGTRTKYRPGISWRRVVCRLVIPAYLLTAVLCLDTISTCTGQKPIKVGEGKKHDLFIAGLFPLGMHVPESHIGRGVMPSVKLAIAHVSDNTRNKDYRLHMWWNDTECNAAVGVKAFFDMMHSGPHKLMLFGAACTQVTDPIAKASKHWRLTQLSYADTHPMFTSDSFPNFFRVVPSENAFNAPRLALLLNFNWTRVGTIYQNEPRYALAHNRLVAELDDNNIEIVETQSFATEVTSALEKLKEQDARIILGNFNEVWARRIFCEAYKFGMFGRKYQWIIMGMYNEEWWLRPGGGCAPVELMEALRDTILTDLLPLSTDNRLTVAGITPREYQEEYDRIRKFEYSRFHGYAYDGIWTIALAIEHVQRRIRHFRRGQTIANFKYRDPLWEKLFLEALRNTSFEGVTGTVRFYDNERKANILLKQFQNGSEEEVGEFDGETGVLNLNKGQPLVWRGKSPPKDRTRHNIKHSTVNITIYAVLTAAASVGIVLAFVFLAINIKYRNQRYIKMSSPHLNNLIIVGCMLSYSSVIFLGLDSQLSSVTAFPYICTARACLLMVGFSLAFGSMFSKTWRVHTIFTDVKLNKKVIKDYQLFMVVGVLLLIDMAIITTWQVADPFYRETKQMEPYPDPSSEDIMIIPENEYCQSNRMTVYLISIYAYKGLLMIFGAFLAWETRHVSMPALNDSKYVGMSVYNVVISCLTGAAISFVLDDNQDVMFIMLSVLIIFCSTGTLCFVFVPKIIELRRNPDGVIDKRTLRPTLRPASKTRRSSSISELEERLKEATLANQKFRKQLLEKDGELQMFLRRLADDEITNTQEAMDRLAVPKQEEIVRKEEPTIQRPGTQNRKGLSVTTETTDVSMSMCSLNSTTVSQPEGDYVNVCPADQQTVKKKTSFSPVPAIAIDNEQRGPSPRNGASGTPTSTTPTTTLPSALKQQHAGSPGENAARKDIEAGSIERPNVEFVPEAVEETDSIVLEETEIPRDAIKTCGSKDNGRPRLPTPPPGLPTSAKNVSFGRLDEPGYLEQAILPPPIQFIPRHRQIGTSGLPSHHTSLGRRSSVKNNGMSRSHREILEIRRTSVPSNAISYISTESGSSRVAETSFEEPYVIGECSHKRALTGGTGYRCEKHGGIPRSGGHGHGHGHGMLNGTMAETPPASRRHRKHHSSHNASSPSVPATVNASYSDTEKYEESMSMVIQRSVSERSREKCSRVRSGSGSGTGSGSGGVGGSSGSTTAAHPIGECPHRAAARRIRECRHHRTESKLRSQQARLEYVQSTPNVATIHNSKFGSASPREEVVSSGGGAAGIGSTPTVASATGNRRTTGSDIVVGGSSANVSKIYSAVSDGELLDLAILPIFQKLLTERHKSSTAAAVARGAGGGYGASVASCPNISIKCDIVEYL